MKGLRQKYIYWWVHYLSLPKRPTSIYFPNLTPPFNPPPYMLKEVSTTLGILKSTRVWMA